MNTDNPFKVDLTNVPKEKIFYSLAMFPYPSGAGLHVGHALPYTANDIIARYKRMQGFSVINPIGWDSFGLPTEGYAMKVGKPASEVTQENIASFISQCKLMDRSYDRDREFATSDPAYYKWTQWIFQQLFKAGLVYRKDALVNRCPHDQTVLANDQVVDGKCERCGTEVIQKKHMQRFIKITDYAEQLINDLDLVDRPEETKTQQKYRIGKSEGAEIQFPIFNDNLIGDDKKENVFLLHGKKRAATNEIGGWMKWTQEILSQKGYQAVMPFVDNSWKIFGKDWESVIDENKAAINENTTLIGHSSGAAALVRWLGKNPQVHIKKLILVAPGKIPAPDGEKKISSQTGESLDPAEYEGIKDLYDFIIDPSLKDRVSSGIYVVTSNDEERLLQSADMYISVLAAHHVIVEGRVHFHASLGERNNTFPELIDLIESTKKITVFTTRPDTIYGVTAIVLAPENEIIDSLLSSDNKAKLEEYRKVTGKKTALERQQDAEERSGMFSGVFVKHPLTGEQVPVWYADYVLADYATGAVMFVPAHDERDDAFAYKNGLELKVVVVPKGETTNEFCYTGEGVLIRSGEFDGMKNTDAKKAIIDYLEKNGLGKRKITYKLRDWSVSRQRYWGSPIPVYYDENGNPQLIPEDELPVLLPLDVKDYKPAGKSPLADHPTFPHYTPVNTKVPLIENHDDIRTFQPGVEVKKRKIVQAIIKDKNSEKFLALNWKIDNSRGFVAGGVEEGENQIEALKREILEESGYSNVDVKYQVGGEIHKKLYHAVKHYNQYSRVYTYYVEVDASAQRSIDTEELVKHEPIWMSKEKLLQQQGIDPDMSYLFDVWEGKNPEPMSWTDKYNEYNPQTTYVRECDTLDTFMCSSFYFLRFIDPKNTEELVSKELADKTLPVDFYLGGKEHIYGHLLYSRFIHKFLFDQGYVSTPEPFAKLFHQGMLLGPDGRKMSKRWGNVIIPEDLANKYGKEKGIDILRTYTMFMGPLEIEKAWNDSGVDGVKRFLERVERLEQFITDSSPAIDSILHKTIKGVSEDIEKIKFNTAVSKLMVFVNDVYDKKAITKSQLSMFLQLLAPFATRLTQTMREKLGNAGNIHFSQRPVFDQTKIAEEAIDLPVQINGKMRGTVSIAVGTSEAEVMSMIQSDERFIPQFEGKQIAKIIFVQDKIINLIIK